MNTFLMILLRLFLSLIVYIVIYASVEFLTVSVIRIGTSLGRLLRPIEKRNHSINTGITFSGIICTLAWLSLTIYLILFPICLLLFTLNILFWEQLLLFVGLMICISFVLFFLDTALFYNNFSDISFIYGKGEKVANRMKEDAKLGLDWIGYLDNMPIEPFKKFGFAKKYR